MKQHLEISLWLIRCSGKQVLTFEASSLMACMGVQLGCICSYSLTAPKCSMKSQLQPRSSIRGYVRQDCSLDVRCSRELGMGNGPPSLKSEMPPKLMCSSVAEPHIAST